MLLFQFQLQKFWFILFFMPCIIFLVSFTNFEIISCILACLWTCFSGFLGFLGYSRFAQWGMVDTPGTWGLYLLSSVFEPAEESSHSVPMGSEQWIKPQMLPLGTQPCSFIHTGWGFSVSPLLGTVWLKKAVDPWPVSF